MWSCESGTYTKNYEITQYLSLNTIPNSDFSNGINGYRCIDGTNTCNPTVSSNVLTFSSKVFYFTIWLTLLGSSINKITLITNPFPIQRCADGGINCPPSGSYELNFEMNCASFVS